MSVISHVRSEGPFPEGSIAQAIIRLERLAAACVRQVARARRHEAMAHLDALARALRRAFEGEDEGPSAPPIETLSSSSHGPDRGEPPAEKRRDERTTRYLTLIAEALAGDRVMDIPALLGQAPTTRARHRAALAAAATLGQRAERTAARRLLRAIDDPALAAAVALARARLDLDGGLVRRAATRLEALPGGVALLPRARLHRGSRGQIASVDVECAREALVLRFRLAARRAAPAPGPLLVRALLRDPRAHEALWQHSDAADHLFTEVLPLLRGALFFEARSELVASFAIAEARSRIARAAALRGTRADLDAAEAPSAEQAFALGVFGGPPAWESVRRDPRFSDPLSVARTAFDEGVALAIGPLRALPLPSFAAAPPAGTDTGTSPTRPGADSPPTHPSADSPLRAAEPPRGPCRRRALVDASKASLARLVTGAHSPFCVPSRARTLAALGGPRAAAAVEQALITAHHGPSQDPCPPAAAGHPSEAPRDPAHHSPSQDPCPPASTSRAGRRALFRALLDLDPARALSIVLHRGELLGDAEDLLDALRSLERARLLQEGTAARARLLQARLPGRLAGERHRWLCGLLRAFARDIGAPPGPRLLELVSDMLDAGVPASPGALIERLRAQRDALLSTPQDALPGALGEEQIALLLALGPQRFGPHAPEWPAAAWLHALRRLDRDIGPVCPPVIARLRTCLPRSSGPIAAMLRGEPPVPSLAAPIALDPAGRYRLRYLDKRRDLLAFLRFADCVGCCFHSGSRMYSNNSNLDTQAMVLSLWKDPLSFCFQVQRTDAAGVEPVGFVFGSLALLGREPAVLLNGVYMRVRRPHLRFAVVAAIEQACCLPLGIRRVAIAAVHGGRGPLPPGYRTDWLPVVRLRALCGRDGRPETRIYDDLSHRVNVETQVGYNVFWRTLDD